MGGAIERQLYRVESVRFWVGLVCPEISEITLSRSDRDDIFIPAGSLKGKRVCGDNVHGVVIASSFLESFSILNNKAISSL